jgi:hypothetical protein
VQAISEEGDENMRLDPMLDLMKVRICRLLLQISPQHEGPHHHRTLTECLDRLAVAFDAGWSKERS